MGSMQLQVGTELGVDKSFLDLLDSTSLKEDNINIDTNYCY